MQALFQNQHIYMEVVSAQPCDITQTLSLSYLKVILCKATQVSAVTIRPHLQWLRLASVPHQRGRFQSAWWHQSAQASASGSQRLGQPDKVFRLTL